MHNCQKHKTLRKNDSGHMLNGDGHRTEAAFIKETRISPSPNEVMKNETVEKTKKT